MTKIRLKLKEEQKSDIDNICAGSVLSRDNSLYMVVKTGLRTVSKKETCIKIGTSPIENALFNDAYVTEEIYTLINLETGKSIYSDSATLETLIKQLKRDMSSNRTRWETVDRIEIIER